MLNEMTIPTFLRWQQFFRQQQAAADPASNRVEDPEAMEAMLRQVMRYG